MNLNLNKGNRKEVENVSTRVKKTKEEIEQLKTELEKLINLGSQPSYLKPVLERKTPELLTKPSNLLPQESQLKNNVSATQKRVDLAKVSSKSVVVLQKKTEPVRVSPTKKTRTYNVVEAREFIKKQKEKRAEQLKAQINVADNQLDLKKQKLKELHQKTIELVTKNVQLKRDRSKSRDREPPIRLDKSNPRHKSQENIPKPRQNLSSKSQERQKFPMSGTRGKSQERSKSQERPKFQEQAKTSERASRVKTRQKPEKIVSEQNINPKFLYPPNVKLGSKSENLIELEKTVLPPSEDKLDLNKRIVPSLSFDEKVDLSTKKNQRPKKQKQLLEHSIMTDACFKDTKETQTNHQNNFEGVGWMQPPPALPYPYNFINTVKRKLQHAINSPKSCVDVGVQNSGDSSIKTPEIEKAKSKEEIKELLIKSASELRSFASHRGPNLDLKVVENLELIPNNLEKDKINKETFAKNLFTGYESESDTSKNIPEISSESLESVQSKPQLSLDKLKDLKLQNIPKAQSILKTDTIGNGYPEDAYSSDFHKENGWSFSANSGSSTIQTIASETKQSDASIGTITSQTNINKSIKESIHKYKQIPSYDNFINKEPRGVSSEISIGSTMTDYSSSSSSNKSTKDDASQHSEIKTYSSINQDPRSEVDSQRTFKSLLTDGQVSKSSSGVVSEASNSDPVTESSGLKEPSVSLSVTNTNPGLRRNLMNAITIRSGVCDLNLKYKENGDSLKKLKLLAVEEKLSNGIEESVSESLHEDRKSKSVSGSKVDCLDLKEPKISLVVGKEQKRDDAVRAQMKNITLRPTANNVNEIHLKFEAEVRLLNDFNESFRQFIAVEKAFENLKTKNETNLAMTKILQNVDTQTSVITKTSTNVTTPRDTRNSSINFSRGSEIIEEFDSINRSKSVRSSTFSTDWNLSNVNESSNTNISEEKSKLSISSLENCNAKNCASILSLNIFDQLIKDEDTRIQQLKAIIKIREQALLDRTRSELVWLEIQKKQLIETGKIEEASLLKKKQRGIIVKHEQERNEIKKLKQMQKEASEHRKNTLKQQRNFIKTQLSTDNMLSKISVKKQRKERRSMGPLRVVQSCSESIHSEASISLKSSGIEDVLSITSKSVRVSEDSELELSKEEQPVSNARRTLLMREAALQKRRKAAEELLRWHRKLLDEERKIGELEAAATSVVRQDGHKYRFCGDQLNQLWRNMTGSDEKKFVEEKVYGMSQIALERLCKNARQHSKKKKSSEEVSYSSAFEPESVHEIISQEEKTKISSISELIDNFSRIEDEISTLSKKSEDIVSLKEDLEKSSQEKSEIEDEETSVVEVGADLKKGEEPTVEDLTKKEDLEVPESVSTEIEEEQILTRKEDLEELKTIEELEQKIATDEEISSEKEDLDQVRVVSIATDDQVSLGKEDYEGEVSPKIEDLEEVKLIREETTATDEQISTEEPRSTPEISTIEDQKITTDGAISSTKSDLERAESVEKVSTLIEAETDDLVKKSLSTSNEQISIKSGDLEEPKLSEQISSIVEERENATERVSEISEDLEEFKDQKSSNELFSTQYEDVAKQTEFEDKEATSEQISTKDEDLENSKISSVEDLKESRSPKSSDEGTAPTIEDGELSSVPLTDSPKEASPEAVSKEITRSLSLEEALESASKIEESLSKLNEKLASEKRKEEISEASTGREVESIEETPSKTSKSETATSVATETEEKTPQKKNSGQIDVKKRVSEILADASPSRGDKSPRLQDLYVTAYDVEAPISGDLNESTEEGRQLPTDIFGSEAEELWRKQLAIEQEIKQIELQQKEQLPYVYVREIPNKPPPPYTPPSSLSSLPSSILPSDVKEITELACYSSKVLHKAHQKANMDKVKFSENGFKLFSKIEVTKICADFVFNICKDIAREHYSQFEEIEEPSWLVLAKKPQLAKTKPADANALERILIQKLKELFGFKKTKVVESAIVKWGRKKRDHVDEVLVIESQEEESQWTNFDKDELFVKNLVTEDIMKMLLEETAGVFVKIVKKKCA